VSKKYFLMNVKTCLIIIAHSRFNLFSFSNKISSIVITKGYSSVINIYNSKCYQYLRCQMLSTFTVPSAFNIYSVKCYQHLQCPINIINYIMKCIFVKYLHNILYIFILFFIGFCLIITNFLVMKYFTNTLTHRVFAQFIRRKYIWTNKYHKDGCSPTLSASKKYFFINVKTCLVIIVCSRLMLFSCSNYLRSTIITKGYSNADSFS
jgi:hypothetical protein